MILNKQDYEIVHKELKALKLFDREIPKVVESFVSLLNFTGIDVPKDIKIAMVTFWLSVFSTQFKIKVRYRGTVPLNSLFFIFAPSSTGKDLTFSRLREIFRESMDVIQEEVYRRYEIFKQDNKDLPLPNLEIGFSTSEGMIQNMAVLNMFGIGETFIYSGEFVSEFISNPNCATIFRDINEVTGSGDKNVKQLKDQSKQTAKIQGSGLSALLATDISRLCEDTSHLSRLRGLFQEGLARRSNIVLIKDIKKQEIENFFDFLNKEVESSKHQVNMQEKISAKLKERASELISNNLMGHTYELDDECSKFMIKYGYYLATYVDNLQKHTKNKDLIKLYALHKRDNEFRAIRLASSIALLKGDMKLKIEHIIDAIQLIEYLNVGMHAFEKELNKTLPDLFVEFCNLNSEVNVKSVYTASELLKAGFISSRSQIKQPLENLVVFANQLDSNGFYETDGKTILHTKLIDNNEFKLAYKELPNMTKEQRATKISTELFTKEFETFADIAKVLTTDCAYSSFTFKDGRRNNDSIDTHSSIFIFDVDNSHFTYEQFHKLIGNINHHIAKTSDNNNPNKFRVIVELDKQYNLDMKYYAKIRAYILKRYLLNITVDKLAIAQAYYGYENREVLSVTDKQKINLKEILNQIQIETVKKELTLKERNQILNDTQLSTFAYALNRGKGERNNMLIRVLNHLKDLDATYEKAKEIINIINNTYEPPLEESQLEAMIYPHLNKHFLGGN